MAAGEDQAQRVVADLLAFVPARAAVGDGRDPIGDVAFERIEAGAPPDAVDRLEAPGRDQPWHRIRGNAVARPLLDGGLERVLHRLFGEIEIAEQADQRREDLARVAAIERRHRGADARIRACVRVRLAHGDPIVSPSSDAGAQDAPQGDRADEKDDRGPERIRDAEQADGGVGAAGAGLEDVGQERSSWVAVTILSASVRLHDCERAATKYCHMAAAIPASASSRPRLADDATSGRVAPHETEQGAQADGEKDQPLQHAPRARLHGERVLRHQRDGDRAEREQGDGREQPRDHRPAVARRRQRHGGRGHSAAWAISSISTQAPSGSWATP